MLHNKSDCGPRANLRRATQRLVCASPPPIAGHSTLRRLDGVDVFEFIQILQTDCAQCVHGWCVLRTIHHDGTETVAYFAVGLIRQDW